LIVLALCEPVARSESALSILRDIYIVNFFTANLDGTRISSIGLAYIGI
jgi:hypothetical protein